MTPAHISFELEFYLERLKHPLPKHPDRAEPLNPVNPILTSFQIVQLRTYRIPTLGLCPVAEAHQSRTYRIPTLGLCRGIGAAAQADFSRPPVAGRGVGLTEIRHHRIAMGSIGTPMEIRHHRIPIVGLCPQARVAEAHQSRTYRIPTLGLCQTLLAVVETKRP